MTIKKFWVSFSISISVVFFSVFATSVLQLQSLSQETKYLRDQVSVIDKKFSNFLSNDARLHADKAETYNLISLLMETRFNSLERQINSLVSKAIGRSNNALHSSENDEH